MKMLLSYYADNRAIDLSKMRWFKNCDEQKFDTPYINFILYSNQ